MDGLHRHVLICDPQPSGAELEEWHKVIKGIAASMMRVNSPQGLFEISNDLQHIVENRAVGSGRVGLHVARAAASAEIEGVREEGALYSCVCAMLAVREVIASGVGTKRGVMAVATWSALSFGPTLSQPRLEVLRREILTQAQRVALEMASRARRRSEGPRGGTPSRSATAVKRELSETKERLRRNTALDREEIALLRWLLADRSVELGSRVADIGRQETAALAMGMELGRLLTVFPTVAHHRLGERFVKETAPLDLRQLIDAIGGDRGRLAALCSDQNVVEACPSVFPLTRALAGGPVEGAGARIGRPLSEWWGRALLETAAAGLGSRKGWVEAGGT